MHILFIIYYNENISSKALGQLTRIKMFSFLFRVCDITDMRMTIAIFNNVKKKNPVTLGKTTASENSY
jgi:hypothetical protein